MPATRPEELLRHLHPPDPGDGPLLARFADRRDPAAFAALVRRHGPAVFAVCRRVTGHAQDAEDAVQAAFLVLARSAGAVRHPDRLASWLYGVAVKVAGRARRAAARRRKRETTVATFPDVPAADTPPVHPDIGPALHEELAALPALHRDPIVLCDLHGHSRADAAAKLGIAEGTLSSRLANGRKKLADRLTRRGVALSALGVPAALAEGRAAVPEVLVQHTCGLVAAWAGGGAVPATVARLAAGGFPMRAVVLGGFLTLSLAAGAAWAAGVAGRPHPPAPPDPPSVAAVARPQDNAPPKADVPKKADAPAKLVGPRLTRKLDLNLKVIRSVMWSPDGKWLAVHGYAAGNADGVAVANGRPNGGNELALVPAADPTTLYDQHLLPAGATVVGFTADANTFLIHMREGGLISGTNQLQPWAVGVLPPGAKGPQSVAAAEPGGPAHVSDDAAADITPAAKGTLRYLVRETDATVTRKVGVWTTDNRFAARWPNGSFEGAFVASQLTPDGNRVLAVVAKTGTVEAYDLEGKKLWASATAAKEEVIRFEPAFKGSPTFDAARERGVQLVVAPNRGAGCILTVRNHVAAVLDGATGKALPAPEGIELIDALGPAAVSADGRLAALAYVPLTKSEPKSGFGGAPALPAGLGNPPTYARGAPRLTVWDTATGKVVRTWQGRAAAVAFHPTRPVLAILEPNGTDTRLGFWDFRAE